MDIRNTAMPSAWCALCAQAAQNTARFFLMRGRPRYDGLHRSCARETLAETGGRRERCGQGLRGGQLFEGR
eukprot:10637684-Alexandrium_andersonii.AAC.1